MEPPSQSHRLRWVIGGVVALVLLGLGLALLFINQGNQTASQSKTIDAVINPVSGTSTAADIAKLDKTEAFYAILKRAAEQSQIVVTKAVYFTGSASEIATSTTYTKTGFNYDTKQFVHATEVAEVGLTGRDKSRCVDGKQFDKIMVSDTWKQVAVDASSSPCLFTKLGTSVNDGFNTGGLTEAQAEAFVSNLRAQAGLMKVNSLMLDNHNGKKYLHFSVELQPIYAKSYGYLGAQWLMWSFKKTGIDPEKHPYLYAGAGGDGLNLEYYVDPATKLPVYSELTTLPAKDDSTGKEIPIVNYYKDRTQYEFGSSTFDASPANGADIALTW
jgi:hypothetical protein